MRFDLEDICHWTKSIEPASLQANHGSDIAGLIPILKKIVLAANLQGVTRRAVLCAEGVCHIKSSMGFDSGKRVCQFSIPAFILRVSGYAILIHVEGVFRLGLRI